MISSYNLLLTRLGAKIPKTDQKIASTDTKQIFTQARRYDPSKGVRMEIFALGGRGGKGGGGSTI